MWLAHSARHRWEYLARTVVWDILSHGPSQVLRDVMMAAPFLEVGLVKRASRVEEVLFASACNVVAMLLAGDSILASCGQLGCRIWKLV